MLPSLARTCSSLALSALISWYGVRRKSLDISGGLAAVVVGSVLTAANGGFCVALLTFFFTSSKLTKWKATEKERFESDHKEGFHPSFTIGIISINEWFSPRWAKELDPGTV